MPQPQHPGSSRPPLAPAILGPGWAALLGLASLALLAVGAAVLWRRTRFA